MIRIRPTIVFSHGRINVMYPTFFPTSRISLEKKVFGGYEKVFSDHSNFTWPNCYSFFIGKCYSLNATVFIQKEQLMEQDELQHAFPFLQGDKFYFHLWMPLKPGHEFVSPFTKFYCFSSFVSDALDYSSMPLTESNFPTMIWKKM